MQGNPAECEYSGCVPAATPGLRVESDVLHAFGVTDHEDQMRVTRLLQWGFQDGHDRLHKSVVTMMKYMKNHAVSSRKIMDANTALEAEKRSLADAMDRKDEETAGLLSAKDAECRTRTEQLENELRQKGLEIENLNSTHQQALDKAVSDAHSARDEMDRVQRLCDSKDSEIEVLRRELKDAKSAAAVCGEKDAQIDELKKRVDAKDKEFQALNENVAGLQTQVRVLNEAQDLSRGLVDNVNNLCTFGIFHDKSTEAEVVCPVLCCSGEIMSMKSVVTSWVEMRGGLGTDIAIVPQPQFEVIQKLASVVNINVEPPCVFEYCVDGEWVKLSVFDVLTVASRICWIYRCGNLENDLGMMILKGGLVMMFQLSDIGPRKQLRINVHRMIPGVPPAVYEGRFRITAPDWNPFENMDFVEK